MTLLQVDGPLFVGTTTVFVGLYVGAIALNVREIHSKYNLSDKNQMTLLVVLYWLLVHPMLLWVVETQFTSYLDSNPIVISALNLPSVLSVALLATSSKFRAFVHTLSLRFLIEYVEAVGRIIVGFVFLAWWHQDRLPGYFAWVAGPGDILSGVFAFMATRWALAPMLQSHPAASAQDILKALEERKRLSASAYDKSDLDALLGRVHWAMGLVLLGILDFVAAPASSIFSIAMGQVPEALGSIPLAMVPTCLVPTAFALEIWAMCQLWGLRQWLKEESAKNKDKTL